MRWTPFPALVALAALAVGCGSHSGTSTTAAERARFGASVTNPWFPLRPGSVYRYRGVKDGEPSREVMTVTHRTRTIEGARCVVVSDLLFVRGKLEERTSDYYAQDAAGNVWYFGEDTAELDEHGNVTNRSGSWLAGRKGAKPGIFMFARPRVGRSARQEYLKGEAEDHFQVLRTGVTAAVPLETYRGAMLTKEWTPLEPGVLDHKYYVRGIGTVLEQTVKGGNERNELVAFRPGP
ncbi:MAG TPA: hypothetical protein VLD13_04040 [Gaiellaceae bacterium]|nr:hypothetical protein [Gaiellaceae bacterium]